MPNLDRFESMFRAASRELFRYDPTRIESVLVLTDRDEAGSRAFGESVRGFLSVLTGGDEPSWRDVHGSEFSTAGELLDLVHAQAPSLICTYRNLHSGAWRWPYSLGTHLDVLTQHTHVPVMVLPHPDAERAAGHAMKDTNTVMAITDHLSGDARLVNFGLRFTDRGGTLWLTHVEDQHAFDRYIEVIAEIPEIDTETSRALLHDRLLKGPSEYIESCATVVRDEGLPVTIEHVVRFGRRLSEYRSLIEEHEVDLLVLNTKEEDQLAMHGMAYELAVELRQIPLLML